jgi:hypothetical protein
MRERSKRDCSSLLGGGSRRTVTGDAPYGLRVGEQSAVQTRYGLRKAESCCWAMGTMGIPSLFLRGSGPFICAKRCSTYASANALIIKRRILVNRISDLRLAQANRNTRGAMSGSRLRVTGEAASRALVRRRGNQTSAPLYIFSTFQNILNDTIFSHFFCGPGTQSGAEGRHSDPLSLHLTR